MSIFDNILQRWGYRADEDFNQAVEEAVKRELDKVHNWLGETADAQQWDMPDPEIYANQADMYRLSPLLGSALDILADDVGLTKFNVKRMVGEETRDIPNHEFELLLRTPNPLDSGLEFMRDTTINYKLNGNSIWWLNRDNWADRPDEIWPIPYQMVKPIPDGRQFLKYYEYYPGMGKKPINLPVWQIVHFKTYNPSSRFMGLSPIESLAMTLTGNQGMRKTKARQYTQYGGAPQSILAFKDWVPDDAWSDIKREKKNAALRNEMMMLRGTGDGVSWMSRALSAKDAEFVENLKVDMEDVFNRMAPGLLAMLDKNATEANALAARATYSEKALWKTLETFAQKITADILPAYGRKLFGIFEDPRVVDRKLELEEQAAYERTHTIEEVRREKYGDDPLGDERDKLFTIEIGKQQIWDDSGQAQGQQDDDDQAQENDTAQDTSGDDLTMKAAIDDLMKWRRIAIRGKSLKASSFISAYIPAEISAKVKRDLTKAKNQDEIAVIFNNAAEAMKPKRKQDPILVLATELQRANELLASTQ